ncbi:hypothetical protein [Sphingomonas sp. PR090111-T3T-6A]|nr:hypothetical protein [Sphingomonas sp. PR090111-T3T-6A]
MIKVMGVAKAKSEARFSLSLLATQGDALEALELADGTLDPGAVL